MSVILYHGDCLEEMNKIPDGSVDMVCADPPYPDYHKEIYCYRDGLLGFLNVLNCRQFIFWSAKEEFPLDYTAIHIWDKCMGVGSMYERIFERNGGKAYRIFRFCPIQNKICAQMTKDTFTGHPSQKPIHLIEELIKRYSKNGDTILDPFMGSGTTGVACVNLSRNFIGIEKEKKYFDMAKERIEKAKDLFSEAV